jgi:hypothetical protein
MQIRWILCGIVAALTLAPSSRAVEVTVLNDSTANGVPSTPLASFLPGESTAAWLTASCTGNIVAAQVYWASQVGSAPSQIEQGITLYNAGTHPTPGSVLLSQGVDPAQVVGPTLFDGVMNQFRFLDPPANTKAMSVPITSGQGFVVSLTFLNQSSGGAPFAPAPTIDQDGCQPQKNAVDILPGGWLDACPLGVTGDWILRAVIDCQPPSVPASSSTGAAVLVALLSSIGLWAAVRLRGIRV